MDTNRFAGPVWSLFRAVSGLLFLLHGLASVLGLFGGHRGSGDEASGRAFHARHRHRHRSYHRDAQPEDRGGRVGPALSAPGSQESQGWRLAYRSPGLLDWGCHKGHIAETESLGQRPLLARHYFASSMTPYVEYWGKAMIPPSTWGFPILHACPCSRDVMEKFEYPHHDPLVVGHLVVWRE